jgi:hypothetical protein
MNRSGPPPRPVRQTTGRGRPRPGSGPTVDRWWTPHPSGPAGERHAREARPDSRRASQVGAPRKYLERRKKIRGEDYFTDKCPSPRWSSSCRRKRWSRRSGENTWSTTPHERALNTFGIIWLFERIPTAPTYPQSASIAQRNPRLVVAESGVLAVRAPRR